MTVRVCIASDARDTMQADGALHLPNETGGLLVGYYTPDMQRAVVTEAWPCSDDAVRWPTGFERGQEDFNERLSALWRETDGTRYFLGEWHTHPKNAPYLSETDIAQMRSVARDQKQVCPEPISVLLVRHGDLWSIRVYRCTADECAEVSFAIKHHEEEARV